MIGRLLHWFYCMDLVEAALVVAVFTFLFYLLHCNLDHLRWWRIFLAAACLAVVTVTLYTTLGNRSSGNDNVHAFTPFHSYRRAKITGDAEIYRSNFMNVALFYPAGLLATSLLPRKWPGWRKCILVTLALAIMSMGIEFVQYRYGLGQCEIDDVIHNTLGALLGSLAALMCPLFSFLKAQTNPK